MSDALRNEQDRAWVAQLRAGDERGLSALIGRYYVPLVNFVLRYVDTADAADDVLQELFVRLWEQRTEQEIHGTVRAYLYTAARNSALHAVARRRARGRAEQGYATHVDDTARPFDIALDVEQRDLAEVVRAAVAQLPERCREIFVLSREHGLSYSEIAQALGVSVSTVKTQMGRAIVVLDTKLAPFALGALVLLR
jgi:RNA polymerase sigma-70 factor (ECF subfamily)